MTKSRVIHFFAALAFVVVAAPAPSAAAEAPDAAAVVRDATPTGRCVACW
jgi:hypothetical protein